MKKQLSICILTLVCLAGLSGCLGSDTITDVSVCDLHNNHIPYIGDLVRVTGYLENTDSSTRWQLMGSDGSVACRVAFNYDFGNTTPSIGQSITIIGVVQQDKVDVYSWQAPLLDDCYIES